MSLKSISISVFISFHALVVLSGMVRIRPEKSHWTAPLAYWYSRVTGAGGGFGFFSPNIPREVIVEFVVEGEGGDLFTATLNEVSNLEVAARMTNMLRLLGKSFKNKEILRAVAASLTAEIYRRHPNARSVTLKAFVYDFPNMERFRKGERQKRRPIYSARFIHSEKGKS